MINWRQKKESELADDLITQYQLSPIAAKLFSLRGIDTEEKLDFWFNQTEEDLAEPSLMHDMDKATKRITQALDNQEKIMVYGDYDADGITATTIMTETLSILGADVHYFIPDRFKDGYGPNLKQYQRIVEEGFGLIITVDNGITGVEEVQYAKDHGVDTIITDHHIFQEQVPDAFAIVHCNYPGQKYPFDDYCGAGVAYTICRNLMQDTMPELLELAMIGTIGDMVKVTGEGHIIVKRGLEMLNQTERPGLRALIKNAGLNLGQVTETDIGFNIAPRLNAVGRLANANLAVELLLCDDENTAQEIADKVEKLNDERKELTTQVFKACVKQVSQNGWQQSHTLVIYDPSFHEGVLGLVANKLTEKFHKPTIVLTKNEIGEIKGSGRSISGFNLFKALDPLKKELLDKFGGHDFACGLSLKEDKISALRTNFEESFVIEDQVETREYDFELPFNNLTSEIIDEINLVGPFGTGNPQPIFSITQPKITSFFVMGKEKNHVKFIANKGNSKLAVIGFNKGYLKQDILPFVNQIFVQLSLNYYKNKTTLQGIISDIKFLAPKVMTVEPVVDLRKNDYIMGFADCYILFASQNKVVAQNSFGLEPAKIALASEYDAEDETIVLLDIPRNRSELEAILNKNFKQVYLSFVLDQLPFKKIPLKQDFAKVLRYVYAHPKLRLADYRLVAQFLGLDFPSVHFILRVFFELGFVKMEDSKLIGVKAPTKRPLTYSKYYQATILQSRFASELRNMPSSKLINYVNNFIN